MLRRALTVEQCLAAVEECGAPVVSIPGGEPLLYPHIGELVRELTSRNKYVYLCTNALRLRQKLDEGVFEPSKRLSFSVHMDGLRAEHDLSVCRDGGDDIAILVERAFRFRGDVTIHTGEGPDVTGYLFNRNARGDGPSLQLFEINYHLYRNYFPLWALGRYLESGAC